LVRFGYPALGVLVCPLCTNKQQSPALVPFGQGRSREARTPLNRGYSVGR